MTAKGCIPNGMLEKGYRVFYRAMHPYGMLQKADGVFRYETTLPDWLVAPRTSPPIPPNAARPPMFHAMRVGFLRWELI
ncbi:MAG: hypothetical protein FWD57_04875 [Polyangiaceae bacterium]|nr:hypothetical protein [Polyangiaceae bacterium]